MNILLLALGSHGDVHPFVGIGKRLRERGHQVAIGANEYFRSLIDHAQLEFIEVGSADEYRAMATDRDLWHPLRGLKTVFRGTARYIQLTYDVSSRFCERGDAIIAASSLALGARVAQDRFDLPLATVHLSPAIFQSVIDPPSLPGLNLIPARAPRIVTRAAYGVINAVADSMICPPLNAFRAKLNLPPVRGVLSHYWHSPQRVIGLFPEWFAPLQADWPSQARLAGFPLYDEPEVSPMDAQLRAFLDAGEPPIAFTPGSAMWQAGSFFHASASACAKLGRRGLLLTRHRDHLPARLPCGVIHVHYAPFSQLLPRCAALVHHGGIGSTAQALAAGVPQLVMPFTHDQPDNAERVKRLGAGFIIAKSQYEPDRLSRMLRELINSASVSRQCSEIARRFENTDAIGRACDLIEALQRPRT